MQQKEPEWTTEGKLLIMLTKRGRWWFRAQRETSYNVDEEREVVVQSTDRLNEEQRAVHDEFVAAAFNTSGALYFLDAPGGCGKTFLIQTMLATIQSQ